MIFIYSWSCSNLVPLSGHIQIPLSPFVFCYSASGRFCSHITIKMCRRQSDGRQKALTTGMKAPRGNLFRRNTLAWTSITPSWSRRALWPYSNSLNKVLKYKSDYTVVIKWSADFCLVTDKAKLIERVKSNQKWHIY